MVKKLMIAIVITMLASCTEMDTREGSSEQANTNSPPLAPLVDASAELSISAVELSGGIDKGEQRPEPIIYRGTDNQVRMPAKAEPVSFLGDDVSLNFEQAPLSEVVHAIMGDILQLDYIIDQPIKGEVTLRTRTPVPRDQLLEVLESLLLSNNALMIRRSDGRYLFTGSQQGSKLFPGVSNPEGIEAGFSTVVIPLRYISASNMAKILQPLADEKAFVNVDNKRNILILAGTRDQLDGWLDIVTTFDVDQLAGMSVGLFPLENSDVEEVAAALSGMLEGDEQGELVRVIPMKRLNSILLVTSRSHYLDTLGIWIGRLDSAQDSRFEKSLHVYPVQNTSAGRLAGLLNAIYAGDFVGAKSTETSTGRGDRGDDGQMGGVAPGMSPETMGDGSEGSAIGDGAEDSVMSSISSSGPEETIKTMSLEAFGSGAAALEDVQVVADEDNNSLMIYSTGKQYDLIKAALEQLDIVATQVIIEASILEVSLTDELRYGLEWTFSNGIGNQREGTGLLTNADDGPAAVIPGFSYVVANTIGDIKAVLNVLAEESLINVISTPSVMVLDNHTAYIHVGDQVPIIEQQSTSDASDTSRITQSITYKDTGVKLTVMPSVNAGGLVTMEIMQSVTDTGPIDAATGQRAFLERNIVSKVAVRSNQSVVLGGLIRENAIKGEEGIPILHKLPVVGPLFGATSKEDRRTELLVIITPRVLSNANELQQVSDEMRAQVRHMQLIDPPPP